MQTTPSGRARSDRAARRGARGRVRAARAAHRLALRPRHPPAEAPAVAALLRHDRGPAGVDRRPRRGVGGDDRRRGGARARRLRHAGGAQARARRPRRRYRQGRRHLGRAGDDRGAEVRARAGRRRLPRSRRQGHAAAVARRRRRRSRRVRLADDPGPRHVGLGRPRRAAGPRPGGLRLRRPGPQQGQARSRRAPYDDCAACQGKSFTFPAASRTPARTSAAPTRPPRETVNAERLAARASPTPPADGRSTRRRCASTSCASPRFAPQPPRIVGDTPSRNDPCPCGSGKKYKRCHGA